MTPAYSLAEPERLDIPGDAQSVGAWMSSARGSYISYALIHCRDFWQFWVSIVAFVWRGFVLVRLRPTLLYL